LQFKSIIKEVNEKLSLIRQLNEEQGGVEIEKNDAIELHQLIQLVQLNLFEFYDELTSLRDDVTEKPVELLHKLNELKIQVIF